MVGDWVALDDDGLDRRGRAAPDDDLASRRARAGVRRLPRAGHRRERRQSCSSSRRSARSSTAGCSSATSRSRSRAARDPPSCSRRPTSRPIRRRSPRRSPTSAARFRSSPSRRERGSGLDAVRALLGSGKTGVLLGAVRRREVHARKRAGRRRVAPRDRRARRGRSRTPYDHTPRARPPPGRGRHHRQPRHARGASLDRRGKPRRRVRRHRRARSLVSVLRLPARDGAGMRRPGGRCGRAACRRSDWRATTRSSARWPSSPNAWSAASARAPGGGRPRRSAATCPPPRGLGLFGENLDACPGSRSAPSSHSSTPISALGRARRSPIPLRSYERTRPLPPATAAPQPHRAYPFWARVTAALWLVVLGILVGGAAIPHAQDKPRVVPASEDARFCKAPSSDAGPARSNRVDRAETPRRPRLQSGVRGAIAQLGERLDRTQEVGSSSLPSSISEPAGNDAPAGRGSHAQRVARLVVWTASLRPLRLRRRVVALDREAQWLRRMRVRGRPHGPSLVTHGWPVVPDTERPSLQGVGFEQKTWMLSYGTGRVRLST